MISQNKVVSIVLPTYNRATLLGGAIESCLDQTYKNIELIVVDDGSVDNTEDVVRRYIATDPRVTYLKKENGRLPKALNYGFKHSKGDYLTWTSDDNHYLPMAIEEMVRYLEDNTEFAIVYCDYYSFDAAPAGKRHIVRLPWPIRLQNGNHIGACFLYRREVYLNIGEYDCDAELAEDYDYWLRISRYYKIGHISKPLYLYRIHPDALYSKRYAEVKVMDVLVRLKNRVLNFTGAVNGLYVIYCEMKGAKELSACRFLRGRSLKRQIRSCLESLIAEKASKRKIKEKIYEFLREQLANGTF